MYPLPGRYTKNDLSFCRVIGSRTYGSSACNYTDIRITKTFLVISIDGLIDWATRTTGSYWKLISDLYYATFTFSLLPSYDISLLLLNHNWTNVLSREIAFLYRLFDVDYDVTMYLSFCEASVRSVDFHFYVWCVDVMRVFLVRVLFKLLFFCYTLT